MGCATSTSQPREPHPHLLEACNRRGAWRCDECGRHSFMSSKLRCYRCTEGCDFDLCGSCYDAGNPGVDASSSSQVQVVEREETLAANSEDALGARLAEWSANRTPIHHEELRTLGLLGCGGFGVIELVKHDPSGETYALKKLSKGYVVKTGMQASVMNEKKVMQIISSPFIVKLYATYNSGGTLSFLIEAALGGELYATYNRESFHGKEGHAKFYVAGATLGLEHMHGLQIIYRGCNPENILLSRSGNLKLADFGLSKIVSGLTFTVCGVPDYFSPEMISNQGHGRAVDWWSLGCLTFELLSGVPPFAAAYPMQIYASVMKGINKVRFPNAVPGYAASFIKELLSRDPSDRLPMKAGGIKNIQTSKWYSRFDWDALANGSMEPPYIPVVSSNEDVSNFFARAEDQPPQVPCPRHSDGWDEDFATEKEECLHELPV
eukprot:TRINITY_DN77615_c0_g1_i1.p1 TRINITY_DN77615_c0_g1~~TRINITY_DN77615_c0_g1_i1.p1  ORF type:complete len:436 (+),score=52.32 TRINITY_DN77615_c0_g1_i1:64-1371(+)